MAVPILLSSVGTKKEDKFSRQLGNKPLDTTVAIPTNVCLIDHFLDSILDILLFLGGRCTRSKPIKIL